MEVKSTLRVIDAAGLAAEEGVTQGQTIKRIVGHATEPSDRVRIGLATYEAGSYEQLHWHPIEAYYFVVSGHATVRDIEGREFPVGPGCSIYAPPDRQCKVERAAGAGFQAALMVSSSTALLIGLISSASKPAASICCCSSFMVCAV